jgi:serine/threonine protein kinase
MSPEQAMGERAIDARSDIYALGAVVYEMLTGAPPFIGSSVQAIVAKVLTEKPSPPSTVRDTVSPSVEYAVLTALANFRPIVSRRRRNSRQRWPTARSRRPPAGRERREARAHSARDFAIHWSSASEVLLSRWLPRSPSS